MKFIKRTILTFFSQMITVLLSVIASIVIARVLGPTDMGIYSIILLTFTLIGTFGSLGIGISNTYYGAKKYSSWNRIASNSLISAFLIGIPSIIIFVLVLGLNSSLLNNIDITLFITASIAIPFLILMPYFQYILLGQNKIKEYNFTNIIQGIIYLSLIIIVLFIFKGNLWGIIVSWTITSILASIIPLSIVYKSTKFGLHFNFNLFKKSVIFGLKGYLGNFINFFNYRIDLFFIGLLLNFANVGYYFISVSLAESLWYLPGAVGTIVFARTPGLSDEEVNKSTPQICRNTLFITIIMALILFVAGKYVILILYGSQYLPALEPLWVLLPGIVALSICKVLSNEIAGRGKPIINTYAAIISLIINVPLNIVLIPKIGIIGSALSSSISYSITTIIVLSSFLKLSQNTLNETLILKKEDVNIYIKILKKLLKLDEEIGSP